MGTTMGFASGHRSSEARQDAPRKNSDARKDKLNTSSEARKSPDARNDAPRSPTSPSRTSTSPSRSSAPSSPGAGRSDARFNSMVLALQSDDASFADYVSKLKGIKLTEFNAESAPTARNESPKTKAASRHVAFARQVSFARRSVPPQDSPARESAPAPLWKQKWSSSPNLAAMKAAREAFVDTQEPPLSPLRSTLRSPTSPIRSGAPPSPGAARAHSWEAALTPQDPRAAPHSPGRLSAPRPPNLEMPRPPSPRTLTPSLSPSKSSSSRVPSPVPSMRRMLSFSNAEQPPPSPKNLPPSSPKLAASLLVPSPASSPGSARGSSSGGGREQQMAGMRRKVSFSNKEQVLIIPANGDPHCARKHGADTPPRLSSPWALVRGFVKPPRRA